MMSRALTALLFTAVAGSNASILTTTSPKCRIIALNISATAKNLHVAPGLDVLTLAPDVLASLSSTLSRQTVSGEYRIVGRYCSLTVVVEPSHLNSLQILVHGGTYTKDYWTGLAAPGKSVNGTFYSWVDYFAERGYPTFAIDRICNGESEHENGLSVCQLPLKAAIINNIIVKARSGELISTKFSRIVLVGHSIGSLVSNVLAREYPDAVDAYILTGFTNHLASGFAPVATQDDLVPVTVGPKKYRDIDDPNYFVTTNEAGVTNTFYYGRYSPKVAALDFKRRGTVTTGELVSALLGQLPATQLNKLVMVINGQQDDIFCARPPQAHGDCGPGSTAFSAQTKRLFPNAQLYQWKQLPQTGHDVNLHYSAQEPFGAAHSFLTSQGL